jgi:tetratricopeptide (TPR) repeat protein
MKNYILFFALALIAFSIQTFAQVPYNSALPNGPSKKAVVSEQIGLAQVAITYYRPAVNGREGKIWGELVHKGFIKQGVGPNNPAPWRAGANENTIIEFESDVKIEGQVLAKGKYALFIAYDAAESIIVFSRKTDDWGSFFYDEKNDALRVKIKPQTLEKSVEWLKYDFLNQTPNSAVIALSWEKLSFPFKVEVDALKQQFNLLAAEAQNPRGFTNEGLNIAANWSLTNNYELEKGLEWINLAIVNFGGAQKFNVLATKAQLLEKLGKPAEAATTMKQALPLGNMNDLHQYGRQLVALKKPKEALEIFQMNYDKNPNQFTTLMGMTRGLSANENYPKALEFAMKALPLAPNDANKQAVQAIIDKLKMGKDIN